jgi:homogentisate 1,2-dioxygenase
METSISKIPIWAIPRVVSISKEIQGKINSIDTISGDCVRIFSITTTGLYRVDHISTKSNTTIHTNKDGYNLYLLSEDELMLASVFGKIQTINGDTHIIPRKISVGS